MGGMGGASESLARGAGRDGWQKSWEILSALSGARPGRGRQPSVLSPTIHGVWASTARVWAPPAAPRAWMQRWPRLPRRGLGGPAGEPNLDVQPAPSTVTYTWVWF